MEFINSIIGKYNYGKRVPDLILYHKDPAIRFGFLQGYLDGDGHYDCKRCRISAKTNSPALAYRLQLLMASLNIVAGVHKGTRPKKGTIRGREINQHDYYRIETTDVTLFERVTGLLCDKFPREFHIPAYDCFWLPINNATSEHYTGKVYNFSTDSETYAIKNIVSHNCGRRYGKALALDTPILTVDGFKTVRDIEVGDRVFDPTGYPTTVMHITGQFKDRDCYKIQFSDSSVLIADANHDWIVNTENDTLKMDTEQIYKRFATGKFSSELSVPMVEEGILRNHLSPMELKVAMSKRVITRISKIDSMLVKCITVDNKSHLFLAGWTLIPTHNSTYASYKIISEALTHPGSINWVVSPQFSTSMMMWRKIFQYIPEGVIYDIDRTKNIIYFINKSSIWAKSADRPDRLRGEGIDFLIMEECSYIKENTWELVLRPALMDNMGRALFIGTPKGRENWFRKLYDHGHDPAYQHEWASFKGTSWDNPIIPRSELETLKKTLPHNAYMQEIMAEFISDGGAVFQHLDNVINHDLPIWPEINPKHNYQMAVDLAKYEDYTVIMVMDMDVRELVYFERFSQVDWALQKARIKDVSKWYPNLSIKVDATGVGDPIVEDLTYAGLPVTPFKFTFQSKTDLVKKLQIAIITSLFKMPFIEEIYNELLGYSYNVSPTTGRLIYSAPSGMHDDCVMALGMLTNSLQLDDQNVYEDWEYF